MREGAPIRIPAGLYALCDDGVRPELGLVEKAQALLQGGARIIQLRAKQTPLRALVEQARAVVAACSASGALCIINDRVDLALLCGAHGVHLGDQDLLPADARRLLPPTARVGVTVRSEEGARAALRAGADYVGVGPVFATRTKSVNAPVMGLERLAQVVRESPLPVVAIGGIGLSTMRQVAAAGAHSAAVVSELLLAPDIAVQARALQMAFELGVA